MARSANAYVKINVLADTKQARAQLGGMAGSLQQWANGFQRAGRIATLATAAIAAGLYVVARVLKKSVDAYVEFGRANIAITRLTGISGKAVAELGVQFRMSGVDADKAQTGLGLFSKTLDKARQATDKAQRPLAALKQGTEGYREAVAKVTLATKDASGPFGRLGIALKDASGKLRPASVILAEVRDRLSEISDPATRAGIAAALFGKGFKTMLPWLTKSKDEIKKYNKILAESGVEWGGKQVKGMKDYLQAQREMSLRWSLFQVFLGQKLLPIVKRVFDAMNKWLSNPENVKKVQDALKLVADTIGKIVDWFLKLSDGGKKTAVALAAAFALSGPFMMGLSGALSVASKLAQTLGLVGAASKVAAGASAATAGAAGAGGAAAGGTAAAAGMSMGATFAAVAAPIIAGAIAGELVRRNASPATRAATIAGASGIPGGRMLGTAPRLKNPEPYKLKVDATQAQAAIADLEARAEKLRAKIVERMDAGKLNNKKWLDALDDTQGQIDLLRDTVREKMYAGHLQNEPWNTSIGESQNKLAYFKSLVAAPMASGHIATGGWTAGLDSALSKIQYFRSLVQAPMASGHVTYPPPKALGGIISRPTVALVGEAGPEAIIPLTRPARARQVMKEAGLVGAGGATPPGQIQSERTSIVIDARGAIFADDAARVISDLAEQGYDAAFRRNSRTRGLAIT
jgi:hypothetical protein